MTLEALIAKVAYVILEALMTKYSLWDTRGFNGEIYLCDTEALMAVYGPRGVY
jgi:hypothetical protein